jgi:DNA-binding winged helix-turn-helix (wHTH) protein/Flp pilus assembly protein TadD
MEKLRKFPKIPESILQRCFYAFGTYRLDPVKRLLLQGGEPVPLSPKDFDLLLALVEQHGEVLVKEELLREVWPDTVVEEGNLNRHISTLRKILGESPEKHEYIVTVPGRGYRFVAAVTEQMEEMANALPPTDYPVPITDGSSSHSRGLSRKFGRGAFDPSIWPPDAFGTRRYFGRRAIWLGSGVVATVVLLSLAAIRVPLRPRSILTSTDYVLVSDFANTTGDPVFDDAMKQAVSVQLAESPFLNILSDATVRTTLKLMTKPSDTRLTPEIAREVCQRAGGKAYIAGSLSRLGSHFVIGLNAVECQTGETLAQQQAIAPAKEHVLQALDEAAAKIRKRLGESQSTLQKYDTPLEQATTSSLEALKAFTQGNLARDRKGDAATIPFFKRAIELDPQFALAYDALGLSYSNLDEPGLASEYISKAFALRERASELEKFDIAANYSQIVTGDLESANQISELWAQAYPRVPYPHNLLGVNFEFLGQYEKALGEISEATRLDPDGVVLYSDEMEDYTALNRLNEAKAVYQQALDRKLDHTYLHADRYGIAFLENDGPEMDRQLAWANGRVGAEDFLVSLESDTWAYSGSLRKAREKSRRAIASAQQANQKETAALWQMNSALREAEFGNSAEARKDTVAALDLASTRDVQILAALAMARVGDLEKSQGVADELARTFRQNTVINRYWLPSIRAAIAIGRRHWPEAVDLLRGTSPYDFAYPNPELGVGRYFYPVYLRGEAYLKMNQGNDAAMEFRKFMDHRTMAINSPLAALAGLQLARAYAAQGDTARARVAYQAFFTLWKDGDADIPVLKNAKEEYAKLQ